MTNGLFTQKTGIGHNINAGNGSMVTIGDINITSLSLRDLVAYTKKFLYSITHRDWKTATTYLSCLKSVGSLDNECKNLIEILEYKLNIAQEAKVHINQDLFIELLRNPMLSAEIKDVVESINIHHISRLSVSEAKKRYETSIDKGSFTAEVFYERLASSEDLIQALSQDKSNLFEHELCSLVRCAIRCENFQVAIELAETLQAKYLNYNSKILLSLSKALHIHKIIGGKHFWLIDYDQMKELEEQVSNCLELVRNSDDVRAVQIATILLLATQFQASDLIAVCLDNVEEAKKTVPNILDFLPGNHGDSTQCFGLLNQEQLIINEIDFSVLSSAFVEGKITSHEVQRWLEKGGDIVADDKECEELIRISLYAMACDPENRSYQSNLSKKLDFFLEKNTCKLIDFNLQAIHLLCRNLMRAGLSLYVIKLIGPLLPNIPWCSPALDVYAESLLDSDQLGKLDELLATIDAINESHRLMAVKIKRAISLEDFPKSIFLIDKALTKYPDSCYYWTELLRALHLGNYAQSEIDSAICRMPKDMFGKYSPDGIRLINLIAKSNLPLAESIILEWFIDEPVEMAVNVTNLHFYNIGSSHLSIETKYPSSRCKIAVVYYSGKRQFTKLLVDGCESGEYLLDTGSPLGKLLNNAEVGDELELGIATYKLIERLPAIVGAFRISTNIRHDINTGADCFYQLSVDGDGVDDILNIIDAMSKKQKLIDHEINGQAIPLLTRINETHRNDLVIGALNYLCDKDSNKSFNLFAGGNKIEESVVLDVLSISYLSLTGLCHGVLRTGIKLYVTRETQQIVSSYLEQIGRDNYLSIAKTENGFIRTIADDIAKNYCFNNLKKIFGQCELIAPQSIDMPEEIAKIRDVIDVSHYSSLKASISNSIPFLCLDSLLCSFYHQLIIPLANVNQFMVDASISTDVDKNKSAECHVIYGLAVPLMHRDVVELCSRKEAGQYYAAKIIAMYPNNYPSVDTALSVLTACCLKSICSAYLGLKGQFSLSEWRYTEHVVYACCESSMICLNGDSCEQRIAVLITQVFKELSPVADIAKLALVLFRQFIQGHFLDAKEIEMAVDASIRA